MVENMISSHFNEGNVFGDSAPEHSRLKISTNLICVKHYAV